MRIEDFFIGRLEGWGAVTTLSRRVSRRFVISMQGVWRERERALQLEESFSYGDGPTLSRAWSVHVDPEGLVAGIDAAGGGRLSGRKRSEDVRLRYIGPSGPGRTRATPPLVIDFMPVGGDGVLMAGRAGWGPLVVGRLHGALRRVV